MTAKNSTLQRKVSIVIPTLNQGEFIEETIISISRQTYKNIEIIIVDGGSTDQTLDILNRYKRRINYISEPDTGISEALNKGFDIAKGEIIGWLNSDDVYFGEGTIEHIVHFFNTCKDVDVVYGDAVIISRDSTLLKFRLLLPYRSARMIRANRICQPATFMRKRVIDLARPGKYLTLDYEYWLRLDALGITYQHTPKILAGDRQHQNRISKIRREEMNQEMRTYREAYLSGRNKNIQRMLLFIDRLLQILLRIKGVYLSFLIWLDSEAFGPLAFPLKIDSLKLIIYRELFMSATGVE